MAHELRQTSLEKVPPERKSESREMRSNPANELNGMSIKLQLAPSQMPPNVSGHDIDEIIREMAESARRLMLVDEFGGLPGIQKGKKTYVRQFLELFSRRKQPF